MSENEEKPKVPEIDEISIDVFETLSDEAPPRGKVDAADLLAFISEKAKTCSGIAKEFKVTYSAMHSRLARAVEKGTIKKGYRDGKAYFLKKAA